MNILPLFRTAAAGLFFTAALAQAASVSGTVTNKTNGKPAAGDTIILVEPMSGMSEIAHTTIDARGHYTLALPAANPYLIRVRHQGADYFASVPPGGGTADTSVFDVAAKVDGIKIDEHVLGYWTENGQLKVAESYTLHNTSSPLRTQWSHRSFEVIIPEEAVGGDASAQRPGVESLPTNIKLESTGVKGHYSFDFPIEPDVDGKGTQFRFQYTLPYSGSYTVRTSVTLPAAKTWVVLPKAMSLAGGKDSHFDASPQDPSVQTFVGPSGTPDKVVEFTLSGSGSFPREDQGQQNGMGQAASGQPGGGMGNPIESPDPLSKYKWWILGALALLMVAGAAFMLRKPEGSATTPAPGATPTPVAAPPADKHEVLLATLKEELFSLESDKLSGKISDAEYAENKAALEVVLKRALNSK